MLCRCISDKTSERNVWTGLNEGWLMSDVWAALTCARLEWPHWASLGLIGGFWFQVGSHPCGQGDSGARGKTFSALLTHVWSSTHQMWDLCRLSLCCWLEKRKLWFHFSWVCLCLWLKSGCLSKFPYFFVVVWLQYLGSATRLFAQIRSSPAAVHGMTPVDLKNPKQILTVGLAWLYLNAPSWCLSEVWKAGSSVSVTLSVCRFCRSFTCLDSAVRHLCTCASQLKAWQFSHSSAWALIALIKKNKEGWSVLGTNQLLFRSVDGIGCMDDAALRTFYPVFF